MDIINRNNLSSKAVFVIEINDNILFDMGIFVIL